MELGIVPRIIDSNEVTCLTSALTFSQIYAQLLQHA